MSATVGAFEAKTHFSELLERAAKGEEIVITRHGTPVAKLVPMAGSDRAGREAAIERLKTFRKGRTLGDVTIRELIEQGRTIHHSRHVPQ